MHHLSEGSGPIALLAVESSCDETAAAVLTGPDEIASNVVHSQIDIHARYGGVVPELASRSHILAIQPVVDAALRESGRTIGDIDAIAVTAGPGLTGSLLVGVEFTKALAWSLDVPLVAVNHLEGHLLAAFGSVEAGFAEPAYPFVALIVSGGHTSLYAVRAPGEFEELGRTLDDAAGEAFDKVSKELGLGYPGGAVIDRLAANGDPAAINFPRPMLKKGGYHFSFSGIKTAVAREIRANRPSNDRELADLAASFREAVAEVLVTKTLRAARQLKIPHVMISGGVACNARLRSLMLERATRHDIKVTVPPLSLCTDNAAMIGIAGYRAAAERVGAGRRFDSHQLDPVSTWPLGRTAPDIAAVTHGKTRKRGRPEGPHGG